MSATFASVFFWPLWEHWLHNRMRIAPSLPPPHSQLTTETQTAHKYLQGCRFISKV